MVLQLLTKYYRKKKTITGTFGLFYRSSALAQLIIQEEEEEVAAKVAVCNLRLVSL